MSPVNRNASPFVLRSYQRHAVDAIESAWRGDRRPTGEGRVNRVATVAATGLGKTVVFSELIARAHARRERALVLVHREELADQAMRKLHSIVPAASIGLVKAERNEWDADVVVASVPTIGRSAKRREQIPADRFGIGICDEAHHSSADTWQRTMHYFGAFDGRSNWAGFTATMARGDDRQLGETWIEVTAEYDISFGIRNKFLVPVSGKRIRVRNLQLDEVKRSRGDYQDNDLGEAMEDADAGNTIADAYERYGGGRRAAMFSPTKSTARRFADDLNARGIPTEVVLGETTTQERTAIYERFRRGETKVISSCMVITEGWDAPWAEVAIMARPTTSNALYIQCIGRVLRPFPAGGKTSALVLDVVGASAKNKLVSLVELHELKDIAPYDAFPDGDDDPDGVVFGTGDDGPGFIEGEIVATEIELFDTSDSAWLQTQAGVWFIPTKTAYFYLWPKKDGSFGLGKKPVGGPQRKHGVVLENGLTLEGGMAWAERYAVEEEGGSASISNRHASWRRKRPSEALQRAARAFRLPTEGLNQGELGDLLTVAKASLSLPIPAK